MATAETGKSRFDLQAAIRLDSNVQEDRSVAKQLKAEMGRKLGEMVKVRAIELASLGVFPEQPIISFDTDRQAMESKEPLIALNYSPIEQIGLNNDYVSVGFSLVVDSDGEITQRPVYEKGGRTLISDWGVSATLDQLCDIGPKALEKIFDINSSALQDPKNHRLAGE